MANMISPLSNDPMSASMLAGSFDTGGMPIFQGKLQEQEQDRQNLREQANQVAREMAGANSDITNAYLMAEMAKQGAYNSPSQQVDNNQQVPAFQRGLLYPVEAEDAMIQGRPMESVEQELAQQQQAPQTLNQLARQFAEQIIKAKALYGEGEKAGNAEAMQYAHEGAERARAALQQLGYNPDAYGFSGNLAQAQQGLADNDLRAMQNIIGGDMSRSSIAHYDDNYNYLINQGYSREIAAEVAGQKARSYAVQRTQELENAFNMYGHDGTTINPMGVQLLQKLAEEEPDMANYYVGRYAGPLQEYAANRQERNMAIQQANKEKNAEAQFNRDLKKIGVQAQYKALLQQNEAAQKEAQAQRDYGRKVALEVEKARIKVQYGLVKGKGKSGRSSGSSDDGGFKPTEALSVIEKYNKWNSDHEGEEWQNPLTDAYDEALATLNRQSPAPHDINNADSVYSWAQSVLEYNARNGYPATPEGLYQAIAAVGGYGPAVAEDLKNDPNKPLEKYGRTN